MKSMKVAITESKDSDHLCGVQWIVSKSAWDSLFSSFLTTLFLWIAAGGINSCSYILSRGLHFSNPLLPPSSPSVLSAHVSVLTAE